MADETDDTIVIHYPWIGSLVRGLLGCILVSILFPKEPIFASVVSVAILIRYAAEKRRKLEISAHEIAYWPPLSRTRRARFEDITSIEKSTVARSWGGRLPSFVPGVQLQFPNYENLRIPLDLPNSDEVYDKIFKAWERQRVAR